MKALLALLLLLPGAASALAPSACEYRSESNGTVYDNGKVIDLGQGMVLQNVVWDAAIYGGIEQMYMHCASGKGFAVSILYSTEEGSERETADVPKLVRGMIASGKGYTIADMRAELARKGVTANEAQALTETCGCAAFYPDDRNGKRRWRKE